MIKESLAGFGYNVNVAEPIFLIFVLVLFKLLFQTPLAF
tara:strand:- start:324 stop:440 length:117 start_codon:yes stop_codon:yes gene_type:complete